MGVAVTVWGVVVDVASFWQRVNYLSFPSMARAPRLSFLTNHVLTEASNLVYA
jgi:hypothetical protein